MRNNSRENCGIHARAAIGGVIARCALQSVVASEALDKVITAAARNAVGNVLAKVKSARVTLLISLGGCVFRVVYHPAGRLAVIDRFEWSASNIKSKIGMEASESSPRGHRKRKTARVY